MHPVVVLLRGCVALTLFRDLLKDSLVPNAGRLLGLLFILVDLDEVLLYLLIPEENSRHVLTHLSPFIVGRDTPKNDPMGKL